MGVIVVGSHPGGSYCGEAIWAAVVRVRVIVGLSSGQMS